MIKEAKMADRRVPEEPRRPRITRRRVLTAIGAATLAVPAAGVVTLRLQDNPLPPVEEPEVVLSGTWLLDASDLANESALNVP